MIPNFDPDNNINIRGEVYFAALPDLHMEAERQSKIPSFTAAGQWSEKLQETDSLSDALLKGVTVKIKTKRTTVSEILNQMLKEGMWSRIIRLPVLDPITGFVNSIHMKGYGTHTFSTSQKMEQVYSNISITDSNKFDLRLQIVNDEVKHLPLFDNTTNPTQNKTVTNGFFFSPTMYSELKDLQDIGYLHTTYCNYKVWHKELSPIDKNIKTTVTIIFLQDWYKHCQYFFETKLTAKKYFLQQKLSELAILESKKPVQEDNKSTLFTLQLKINNLTSEISKIKEDLQILQNEFDTFMSTNNFFAPRPLAIVITNSAPEKYYYHHTTHNDNTLTYQTKSGFCLTPKKPEHLLRLSYSHTVEARQISRILVRLPIDLQWSVQNVDSNMPTPILHPDFPLEELAKMENLIIGCLGTSFRLSKLSDIKYEVKADFKVLPVQEGIDDIRLDKNISEVLSDIDTDFYKNVVSSKYMVELGDDSIVYCKVAEPTDIEIDL